MQSNTPSNHTSQLTHPYIISLEIGATNIKIGYKSHQTQPWKIHVLQNTSSVFYKISEVPQIFQKYFHSFNIYVIKSLTFSICGITDNTNRILKRSALIHYLNASNTGRIKQYKCCQQFQKYFKIPNFTSCVINDAMAATLGSINIFGVKNILNIILGTFIGLGVSFTKNEKIQVYGCQSWSSITLQNNQILYNYLNRYHFSNEITDDEIYQRIKLVIKGLKKKYKQRFNIEVENVILMGGNSIKLNKIINERGNLQNVIGFDRYEDSIGVHLQGSNYYLKNMKNVSLEYI